MSDLMPAFLRAILVPKFASMIDDGVWGWPYMAGDTGLLKNQNCPLPAFAGDVEELGRRELESRLTYP